MTDSQEASKPPDPWWKAHGWKLAWAACSAFLLYRAGAEELRSGLEPWVHAIVMPPGYCFVAGVLLWGILSGMAYLSDEIHPGCGLLFGIVMLAWAISHLIFGGGYAPDHWPEMGANYMEH